MVMCDASGIVLLLLLHCFIFYDAFVAMVDSRQETKKKKSSNKRTSHASKYPP